MNIISGVARNLPLVTPPDMGIRPTVGRAREALFASLGSFAGSGVLDLCAGSGALALEAASRGAAWAAMVENDPAHGNCIRENCRRTAAAGCPAKMVILEFDVLSFPRYLGELPGRPDIVFADPPYKISARLFHELLSRRGFTDFVRGARLIWEVPDTPGAMGEFLGGPEAVSVKFRRFGGTVFLMGEIR